MADILSDKRFLNSDIIAAAHGLAGILQRGPICELRSRTMSSGEQGFSGAEVRRFEVVYENGGRETMIAKHAPLKERMAMKTLTDQGHLNTPAAFCVDYSSPEAKWMVLQDVGSMDKPPPGTDWIPLIADALAGIHVRNLQRGVEMPWLPHADRRYWKEYLLTQITVDHFEALMEKNPDFAKEFGKYLPALRKKAETFADDMCALYDEGDSLTLTHGDLQTVDGSHVHYHHGNPYIIDFGWCHYAPFYIDLASFFSLDDAKHYYGALRARGVPINYADFCERYRAAIRYSGFIYLYPSLVKWASGPTASTGKRLIQMLRIILSGDFPERKIHYSDKLFETLLLAHRKGAL